MDKSHLLQLPYIMPSQAQKHVTHNEAIRALDAIVQLSVLDRDLTSPPGSPAEGDRYIVASGATDGWAGKEQLIAAWQDGTWMFYTPQAGWIAWVEDEEKLFTYDGSVWTEVSGSGVESINPADFVGINATADTSNRLAVSSPNTLFSHEGSDHRVKINKNENSDTASILFQTGWSGRSEFGSTGDDDWHVKVSPDGVSWNEALIADKDSGTVRFPSGLEHAASRKQMTGLIHTPGGNLENSIWRSDVARSGTPRTAVISSISGDVITLTADVADQFFFSNIYMNGVSYIQVFNTSKNPVEVAWIMSRPATNQLQVLDAAALLGWLPGETIQLRDPSKVTAVFAVDISPMMQNQLGAVFRQAGVVCKLGISMNDAVGGSIGISPTGVGGSLQNVFSFPDGTLNGGMAIISCEEQSPISNSNLIYIRETDGGPDTIQIGLVSVFGIYV